MATNYIAQGGEGSKPRVPLDLRHWKRLAQAARFEGQNVYNLHINNVRTFRSASKTPFEQLLAYRAIWTIHHGSALFATDWDFEDEYAKAKAKLSPENAPDFAKYLESIEKRIPSNHKSRISKELGKYALVRRSQLRVLHTKDVEENRNESVSQNTSADAVLKSLTTMNIGKHTTALVTPTKAGAASLATASLLDSADSRMTDLPPIDRSDELAEYYQDEDEEITNISIIELLDALTDRHEIYILMTKFSDDYWEYLQSLPVKKDPQAKATKPQRSFLNIHEYGPFNIQKSSNVKRVSQLLLALTMRASRLEHRYAPRGFKSEHNEDAMSESDEDDDSIKPPRLPGLPTLEEASEDDEEEEEEDDDDDDDDEQNDDVFVDD
ncbi:hypothetical protein UCRPC4_g04228 [Phaeomoniella chlamydospora]|uniref:Uncharacterized protein n=1 Tax=Phaeomoniella chlamydospora TaxID=158046 RepID=A0A0G2EC65_PHACM|nr:hypothetical protein UCRPC4_g04228 [Phaeomoniella chlamydospora]